MSENVSFVRLSVYINDSICRQKLYMRLLLIQVARFLTKRSTRLSAGPVCRSFSPHHAELSVEPFVNICISLLRWMVKIGSKTRRTMVLEGV